MTTLNKKSLFIGLGGAGISILTSPAAHQLDRLLLNTDTTHSASLNNFLQLGPTLLNGHCAGGYMFGIKAIDESIDEIIDRIGTATAIIIVAGFAGGTGGAAPYLAEKMIAKGLQVSLMLCMPLFFEKEISSYDKRMIQLKKVRPRLESCNLVSDFEGLDRDQRMGLGEYIGNINEATALNICHLYSPACAHGNLPC
tara:strand:+ start:3033 stop:3623 length:591 start_codon:yes stop_codon:yes gene_type:complete